MHLEDSYSDLEGPSHASHSALEGQLGTVSSSSLPSHAGLVDPRRGSPSPESSPESLSVPATFHAEPVMPPGSSQTTSRRSSIKPAEMTSKARFRSAAHRVMAMRHNSTPVVLGRVGAEPGVDPRRESEHLAFGHIRQECSIEVVDYSSVRIRSRQMSNSEFTQFLAEPGANAREPWVKVRWINVGGISWDVVSSLAMAYDMHPLAVEDILHEHKDSRSKTDYYQKHLFLRILCHTLTSDSDIDEDISDSSITSLSQTSSPGIIGDTVTASEYEGYNTNDDFEGRTVHGSQSHSSPTLRSESSSSTASRRFGQVDDIESQRGNSRSRVQYPSFSGRSEMRAKGRKDAQRVKLIEELKKGDRVNVNILPMGIFLFRDGVIISIYPDATLDFTAPIVDRLRRRDTVLRTSADASLLVQSLIDLSVDNALEVVEEYQSKILKLEQSVLFKPNIGHVRRLHILQGDLILHKRTLEPIKTVIYGLRRYDVDRVTALTECVNPTVKVQGYMSTTSKTYLADVQDHMEYILSSLDMFAGVSDNLINYTFNMSSHEMNEVMRRLTMVTIIFLPLTLLTGYFGMNFDNMWSIGHGHSDVIFWIIALPVMAIIIPIFVFTDLKKLYHYTRKKIRARELKERYKRA